MQILMFNFNLKKIVSIMAVLILATSCCKKPADNSLEEITDTVRGKYNFISATIQANPIDLNNDGITGTDLKKEFKGLPNGSYSMEYPIYIYPVKEFNKEGTITADIPLQSIKYNKITEKYEIDMDSSMMSISFSYTVNSDGTISTRAINETRETVEDFTTIYNVDICNTKGREITLFGNGTVEFVVDYMFYDFSTDKIVNVPVKFVYERYTYAL